MTETPSTSTASAPTTSAPRTPRQLRAAWHVVAWVVGLGWLGLSQVARQLTAASFLYRVLCFVMAPYAAWAVALLWFNARHPERIANAVAAGPALLVQAWIAVLVAATAIVVTLGRQTLTRVLMVATAALVLSTTWLPPLPAFKLDEQSDIPHP